MRRAFVIVLDACGVGETSDSAAYGDAGASTLPHLAAAAGGLTLPNLQRLGLGSVTEILGVAPADAPVLHGRLRPVGPGKDSTAGHWELMGVVADQPPPTYPSGFPPEVLELVRRAGGAEILGNRPLDGVGAVEQFGPEHLRTGALIVYTSQDSVLQIAAHVDLVPPERLYDICQAVREGLGERDPIGRVIARPFDGAPGNFRRTAGRRDFALAPPSRSYLQVVQEHGLQVHTVGKAGPLFAGVGVDRQHPAADNETALQATTELIGAGEAGLVFTNLIETDQLYGHRHDIEGFHRALGRIDREVGLWMASLRPEDMLILTADHGCDPTAAHSDHTRELVPLLAAFAGHGSRRHDGVFPDVGASVLDWLCGPVPTELPGRSFLRDGHA